MSDQRTSPRSDADERRGNWWVGCQPYVVALASVALAAGIRWLLDPYFGDQHFFIFFVLTSYFAAWNYGWKPALVAMFMGLIVCDFLFIEPRFSLGIIQLQHQMGAAAYLSVTGIGILMAEARRVAQRKAETHAQQLQEEIEAHHKTQEALRLTNGSLDAKVRERTLELTETNSRLCDEIAARQEVETELRRAAAILTSSNDAIIGRTNDRMFNYWNAAAERLFGYTAEEVLGKPISLLVPPDRLGELDEKWEKIKATGSVEAFETVRLCRSGISIPVLISMSPILNNGDLVGESAIVRDLTYTKRLEEQLRQTSKMEAIGQLAGGVAHDFNNMLTIICGYSAVLLDQLRAGDPMGDAVTQIKTAGDKAATLTRKLLAYSRKAILEPKILNMNSVVAENERILSRLLGEDIALSTSLASDLGHIKADPNHVDQMIVNLCVNARDAMLQGGKLTIETANVHLNDAPDVPPGDYVMLVVTDTGCGMTEEIKTRIFEPFYTTKGVGEGTGLGLAMIYGFVKQSGGHIAVYSEPGLGTTFKIYLPRVDFAMQPIPSLHGELRWPKGVETILLVEDEAAVRTFARTVLHSCGYKVLEAHDGAEAVRQAEQHAGPVHLLISDVVMPQMSGSQVADRIEALKPGIKVLFCSGYTDDTVVRHGILEAESNFLQKPFSPSVLAVKVRELLDKPM